jgi:putative flippase GtrA
MQLSLVRRALGRLPASLVKCALSSLTSVCVELVLMVLLVSALHINYLAAFLLAAGANLGLGFAVNRHWAFARAASRPALRQLAGHIGVAVIGTSMATGIIWVFVHLLKQPYPVGWAVAGCTCFFAWTYPVSRRFVYAAAVPAAAPAVA